VYTLVDITSNTFYKCTATFRTHCVTCCQSLSFRHLFFLLLSCVLYWTLIFSNDLNSHQQNLDTARSFIYIPTSCFWHYIRPSSVRKHKYINWRVCYEIDLSYNIFKQNNPITVPDRPWGFQEVEGPRFQDNRHMKVVRFSALRTGRLYPTGNIPGTHSC
jgi:hypothetical protein